MVGYIEKQLMEMVSSVLRERKKSMLNGRMSPIGDGGNQPPSWIKIKIIIKKLVHWNGLYRVGA